MIAIAARSLNNVIGVGNKIPWRSSEDFRWFKLTTEGRSLLMGRKTFESLPVFLKDRFIYVLSRTGSVNNEKYRGHEESFTIRNDKNSIPSDVMVCGGEQIYQEFLPYCSFLYLTTIEVEVEGDAFFPKFDHLFESKMSFALPPKEGQPDGHVTILEKKRLTTI